MHRRVLLRPCSPAQHDEVEVLRDGRRRLQCQECLAELYDVLVAEDVEGDVDF